VEVYATARDFRQVVKAEAVESGASRWRTRGLVGECAGVTVRKTKSQRICSGLFAILRFPKRHLTMSTITHEAFHATMRWAERRRIAAIPTAGNASNISGQRTLRRVASIEERAAMVHDELCRRIVRECNRRKLY